MDNKEKLIEHLKNSVKSANFENEVYELVDEFKNYENPFVFVEPIIKLMEENPTVDFGAPGALVHFVEKFYKKGYEQLLVASLERYPTVHTVWMLHRIINDSLCPNRLEYVGVLESIIKRADVDIEVKEEAQRFLDS